MLGRDHDAEETSGGTVLEPTIPTWYMSRRLVRRVNDAADVLDCMTSLAPIRCDLPGAALEAIPVPVGRSSPGGPVRRLRGRLRLRGLGPSVPVELELAAWSGRESELGIRPAGPRLPRGRRAERYFAAAAQALGDLLDRMRVVPPVDGRAGVLQGVS